MNISNNDGPLVLPPPLHGNTFVMTSSLNQMLTARCLFSKLLLEDPHAHIDKLRSVCKGWVGRIDLDMNVTVLQYFLYH